MRSQDWFIPAYRTFFVLVSLPLYVSAQADGLNFTTPRTTTDSVQSTSVLFPSSTIVDTPVSAPAQTSTIQTSTTVDLVNTPIDTPANTPVQGTTTESSVIISESSTSEQSSNPPTTVNTPVGTPIGTPSQDSTTTTELPVDTTSTTEQVDTTSTTEQLENNTPTSSESNTVTTTTTNAATTTTIATEDNSTATITDAPTSTVTGAAATSSVSSVSTEIIGLIPIINSWKQDPENLKDDTKNKVDDVENDIIGVIKELGGDPDKGCDGKRKRGLLGAIGDVINSLVCIAQDLTDISGSIVVGDVTAVTSTLEDVQSKTDELTDEDNDNNSSGKESTQQESTEQESTTTASCTQDTADHVTIICKPTEITQDGTVSTTETCYSSITAEVTGCSVTEATTIISTTGTSAIKPCASDTCGGSDACPMGQLPLSGAEMNLVSTKVDCSALSTITTSELPTGYGTLSDVPVTEPTPNSDSGDSSTKKRNLFSPREFPDNTSPNPLYVASLNPVWVSQLGLASGHWFNFPEAGQGFVGVNGIYGCTAVIIASEKGVYLSHIWENPVFIDGQWNPTSDESFNTNAFEALRDGNQYAQSITALIGDEANPGVLNAIYSPKVFVLTPFTGPNDPTGVTTTLRYQDRAQKLANDLAGVIPGSGGSGYLLGYVRYNEELSTMEPGWLGRAIFEVDMLQSVMMSPHAPEGSLGLRIGRWRLWVEDNLITYQDFWVPDVTTQNNQKRQDSDVEACLVVGSGGITTNEATSTTLDSTPTDTTTTQTPQTPAGTTETTDITQSTENNETSQTPQTPTQTTETAEATQSTETNESTQTPQTPQTPTETTQTDSTKPPTTLLTSILTTPAPTTTPEEQTSTVDAFTGPVLCVNYGGPNVATPYCQCSTTTAGQTFFATAPLISGYCTAYTTFPSEVTLQPTDIVTEAPDPTPWVTTEDNGAILSYTDRTVMYGQVYGTVEVTWTVGEGTPVTLRPADATQTDDNNKGSSECHSIDDACDRAVAEFDDNVIYTQFASYYTRIKSGIIVVASFGQAGCVVEFDCSDWSQGGMNGQQIKDAYQYMKDNDGVTKCGTTYLSNTCHVTSNYCTNCNERHQDIN